MTRGTPSALALAGASGRHKEPGSRPASTCLAQPPSKAGATAPGVREGTDAFPWGAGHRTLRWTHASEQAGKALRSQGHQCVVM